MIARYLQVNHKNVHQSALNNLFKAQNWQEKVVNHHQILDYSGLKGRLMSCSYAPEKGHRNHMPMLDRLSDIFHQHCYIRSTEHSTEAATEDAVTEDTAEENAQAFIEIKYKTRMFYRHLDGA